MELDQKVPSGFLLIDKPSGITSRDCVNQIQRMLPKKTKIGHAGTLDRFATGLLIIGIGRPATRLFQYLMKLDKTYWVRAKLGELTDTLDHTGTILQECSEDPISLQELQQAIDTFGNTYEQTPPIFSAVKWQGKRLSDMARSPQWKKQKLEQILDEKKKTVHIYTLELLQYTPPYATLYAHVSHGTYIRMLIHDIAAKGGTVATTYELKRTAVGPFTLEQAMLLKEIDSIQVIERVLIPVEQLVRVYQEYARKVF
jgi:tRNA pseudouridine55 synthase